MYVLIYSPSKSKEKSILFVFIFSSVLLWWNSNLELIIKKSEKVCKLSALFFYITVQCIVNPCQNGVSVHPSPVVASPVSVPRAGRGQFVTKVCTCENGFAVTPCILSWESDGGPKKGPLMLTLYHHSLSEERLHSVTANPLLHLSSPQKPSKTTWCIQFMKRKLCGIYIFSYS